MSEEISINEVRRHLATNLKGMTISEIARAIGTNRSTTLNILNLLVGSGEITMRTYGRAKVYTIAQKIPVARLLSLSSDLFLILDEELYIEDCNESFTSFFQVELENIQGSNVTYTRIPIFFKKNILEAIQDASQGISRVYEDYVGEEGEESYFRISCIPIQQSDFSTKIALVMHDLTLHKKYEEDLEEQLKNRTAELSSSIHRFATLTDLAPVGIFETDTEGRYIYVNQKWSEITGYRPEEVMGTGWEQTIHGDERDWITKLWYEHISEQIPWNHSYRYQKKTGEEVFVLGTAVPLRTGEGEISGFIGTIVDISDRVAAEEVIQNLNNYLTSVLEDANDGIATLDFSRKFISCNAAGCRILGHSLDDLIGQSIRRLYKSEQYFQETGSLIYPELSLKGRFRGEIEIIRGDGEDRIIEISISNLKQNGTITGTITIFRDVTESSRAKTAALQQEEQLKIILDGLHDAVNVIDRDGNILYANGCASRYLTESDMVSVVGKNISDYFPKQQVQMLLSYYQEIIDSQIPESRRLTITIRGQDLHFLNRTVPIQFGERKTPAVLSLSLEAGLLYNPGTVKNSELSP